MSVVILVAAWFGVRQQAAVGDIQFARSMIPHHSGAILMCRQADLRDAELKALCQRIIKDQLEEIAELNGIFTRLRSGN